ncbi:MAG: PorT family protein [Chitinophagales bacterium]|nr:PorT family protein [Chitinophagales bacterium]MCO5280690.1 PorT family protein [Chitinophagales bacterium]HRN93447.1 porin family protein [Chitinophagales bacterium]HRP39190.1 porin family protein [Chitinophagales bacterium]
MKKIIGLLFALIAFSVYAQDTTTIDNSKEVRKQMRILKAERLKQMKLPKDRIAIDLLGTNWIHHIGNGFNTKWYSRGINVYFYWDFRIKKSRVSFAPGIGYSGTNIYHRSEMVEDSTGISFQPMDATKLGNIKVNKLTLQYIDIPLEIRIRTNPDKADNFWKFAIGFKAGIRIDAHTKQTIKGGGENKVYVERRFPDFNLFRAGPTLRIGYSVFNLTAYYGVVDIFKSGKGPKANEFAIGISFNGL